MRKIVMLLALAGLCGTAAAQSRTVYDYQSGNTYIVGPNASGTAVQGYNFQTGSNWRSQHNNDGSYNGTDGDGNYYSGNNNTGSYFNSNGTTCFGTGNLRTCN